MKPFLLQTVKRRMILSFLSLEIVSIGLSGHTRSVSGVLSLESLQNGS
jgi:hypothetical protein